MHEKIDEFVDAKNRWSCEFSMNMNRNVSTAGLVLTQEGMKFLEYLLASWFCSSWHPQEAPNTPQKSLAAFLDVPHTPDITVRESTWNPATDTARESWEQQKPR